MAQFQIVLPLGPLHICNFSVPRLLPPAEVREQGYGTMYDTMFVCPYSCFTQQSQAPSESTCVERH